jgi:hypothetical protein
LILRILGGLDELMFNEQVLRLALEAQTKKMAAGRLPSVSRRRSAWRLRVAQRREDGAGGQAAAPAPVANRRVAS